MTTKNDPDALTRLQARLEHMAMNDVLMEEALRDVFTRGIETIAANRRERAVIARMAGVELAEYRPERRVVKAS